MIKLCENRKGLIPGKQKKGKTRFVDRDLSSWIGLGSSEHVPIPTRGSISHASDQKMTFIQFRTLRIHNCFLGKRHMILHDFVWMS